MSAAAPGSQVPRPDRPTLAAFLGVVLIGGSNVVAVRLSNQDAPPFFAAGARFALAALLFLAIVAVRRIPLPRGRALVGTVLYGLLGFGASYALAYRALVDLPAGIGGVIMASVPLLTFFFALAHGIEPFRWRALAGAAIALVGIAVLVNAPLTVDLRVLGVIAMFGAAAGAAEAGVLIKRFPPSHPVATNGIAMGIGSLILLAVSMLAGERWAAPERARTWIVFAYLVLLGSLALFALYLFVLKRWTASGASYQFVLMPVVSVLLGAWLAGEDLTVGVLLGGAVILVGVYVGALSHRRVLAPAPREQEVLAQRCSST